MKPLITLGSDLCIVGIKPDIRRRIIRSFTFPNPYYEMAARYSPYGRVAASVPRELIFATEENCELYLPRGFDPADFGITRYNLVDRRIRAKVVWPRFRMSLHKEQKEIMESLEVCLRTRARPFGNLLFLASTSVGKTALLLAVARRLGHRALVLCPTEQVMYAWYGDIEKFLGISRKKIGLIKRASFKVGECITLASIQTLIRRKEHWEDLNKQIGTLIIDEVQVIASDSVLSFVSQSPAKWLLGATATATQGDKPNYALRSHFGTELHKMDVMHRETTTSLPISAARPVITQFKYKHQLDNLQWDDLIDHLALDDERNEIIIDNVLKEYAEGRVILLTTKSVQHVEVLLAMLKERGIKDANRLTGSTNQDRSYTTALIKMVNRRKVRIVVATVQAIKIGANIRALDSLHITMPLASKDNLEQLVGRIRRKCRGKKKATITYYLDERVGYLKHLYKRVAMPVFRKCNIDGYKGIYHT